MRTLLVLFVLATALPTASAVVVIQNPTLPPFSPAWADARPEAGPDVPGAFLVGTVVAFEDETWSCDAGPRTRAIEVPTGWNRIVAEYRQRPYGDPWDRLFIVQVEGVEVLRGTTPRTDFTLTKEWTRYASLLPQGGTADVTVATDSWDCGHPGSPDPFSQHAYLTLRFYDDPAQPQPAASGVANFGAAGFCGKGAATRTVSFGEAAPERAVLEFFASNHGEEEAQFYGRWFAVLVDGVEVANVTVFPYTYAILGVYGENERAHPAMWWTAQRTLDAAGVHTGPGEIPPYRIELTGEKAALLHGARDVTLVSNTVRCVWYTSAAFLTY